MFTHPLTPPCPRIVVPTLPKLMFKGHADYDRACKSRVCFA